MYHMDKDAKIQEMINLFNKNADELIPPNEFHFKKYAKENLNPLFLFKELLNKGIDLTNNIHIAKSLNEGLRSEVIQFEGSKADANSQKNYERWRTQLFTLFFASFFDDINNLFSDSQIIVLKQKLDKLLLEMQFHAPIEMQDGAKKFASYIKERTGDLVPPIPENLYYWDYPTVYLIKLYELLLQYDFIEPSNQFIESFKDSNVSPKQRTIWKNDKQTSLFALMYLVYKKQKLFKGELIGIVAHKLFKTKNSSASTNSIKTAYENFIARVNKKYLVKNHPQIIQIVSQLELPKSSNK